MSRIFFVSGWAGYPSLFPALPKQAEFFTPFIDGGEEELLARLNVSGAEVLLGWSTGAHMLLKHRAALFPRFARVILAAPFARFTDYVPERIVRLMLRGFKRAPLETVWSFHGKCGVEKFVEVPESDFGALVQGLEYLIDSSVDMSAVTEAGNVVLAYGEKDAIVPPKAAQDLAEQLFGARLAAFACGHFIPESLLLELAQ